MTPPQRLGFAKDTRIASDRKSACEWTCARKENANFSRVLRNVDDLPRAQANEGITCYEATRHSNEGDIPDSTRHDRSSGRYSMWDRRAQERILGDRAGSLGGAHHRLAILEDDLDLSTDRALSRIEFLALLMLRIAREVLDEVKRLQIPCIEFLRFGRCRHALHVYVK